MPGHAYSHALFAIRIIALPAGCGVAVALITAHRLVDGALTRLLMPVIVLSSAALAAVFIGWRWTEGEPIAVTTARFGTPAATDLVSRAPLGFRPDGQPDGVVDCVTGSPSARLIRPACSRTHGEKWCMAGGGCRLLVWPRDDGPACGTARL